ncbi:MAG TPA: peroxiredoxin-like family protein [Polyangiales bacterium]|nr:peroxiredoxin-like family protein [Polyangiales bacterium]
MTERLVDLLGALHAERLKTWPAEQLQRNIDQRRINEERFDLATAPKPGQKIEPFELQSTDGSTLRSQDLVKNGPAVLVFFRHESCPACNIALPYYDRNLWPTLSKLGIPLVAISPQIPGSLRNVKNRHNFAFHVASDTGASLGRRFGLTFKSEGEPKPEQVAQGLAELFQPTVVVLDANHVVRFIDVTPNWMARTEAEPVLEAVRSLGEKRRAPAELTPTSI